MEKQSKDNLVETVQALQMASELPEKDEENMGTVLSADGERIKLAEDNHEDAPVFVSAEVLMEWEEEDRIAAKEKKSTL